MLLRTYFPLIFFSLLMSIESKLLLKTQTNANRLKKFLQCIEQKPNLNDITLEEISLLMNHLKKLNYTKYQELFTNNYHKIKDCVGKNIIPHFPDGTSIVNLNFIFKDKYDWTKFASCLVNKTIGFKDSPFNKLIDHIKEGKFYEALREEFKLRTNGNMIIKECMTNKIKSLFMKNKES